MRARTILFALTLLCCLTAAIGVIANYYNLISFAERDAQRNAENIVTMLDHELTAVVEGRISQVAVQSAMPPIRDHLSGKPQDITSVLDNICKLNGASLCYLLDKQGNFIASSFFPEKPQTLGKNFAFRPYFNESVAAGASVYLTVGASTKRRGVYFAHRVDSDKGKFLGVVVNKFSPDALEKRFYQLSGRAALMDQDGIVFASNIKEWLFNSLLPLDRAQQSIITDRAQFGDNTPRVVPFTWLDNETLSDKYGNQFSIYRQPISVLPGWSLVYLDEKQISVAGASGHNLLYAMVALSIFVTALVSWLFRHGSEQIRRRQNAESGLRQSEARLLQLSQVATEAVVMHQGDQIIDFNEVTERIFGYPREQLLNASMTELFNPEKVSELKDSYSYGEHSFESEAIRMDGICFPVEVNYKKTLVDGETVGMSCIRDISERKQHEKRVRYQAQFDALTNLPNRKLMRERLIRAVSKARVKGKLAVLMFIDLDDFKRINDSLGHEIGDELLVLVARRLQDAVREEDTLARYGGDEFILLLENQESLYDAEVVAQKILTMLAMEFKIHGQSFFISGSIGIAVAPTDGIAPDELLKKADTAMYRTKDNGRNGFSFYSSDMNSDITSRMEMEQQLRGALERDELNLNYQPIYCLHQKKMIGAEVLLRWNNKQLGQVPPDQFIPVAEQTGMILSIGEWVIREALKQGQLWQEESEQPYRIAINVSPRQFRDGHIVPVLLRVLEETGFDPVNLVIEITEGVLIRNDENTAQALSQIKAMGITLSMDDFGTGYSSLSYLKQFPFDIIKIDRSFVRDLAEDPGDQQLVTAAVAMAKGLGLKVIAEGVETEFQTAFLTRVGCDALQGYYLGRPVSEEVFMSKVIPPAKFKALVEECS